MEYVEMDDFKPGGKHGPKIVETEQTTLESAEDLCLKKAAEVVATSAQVYYYIINKTYMKSKGY